MVTCHAQIHHHQFPPYVHMGGREASNNMHSHTTMYVLACCEGKRVYILQHPNSIWQMPALAPFACTYSCAPLTPACSMHLEVLAVVQWLCQCANQLLHREGGQHCLRAEGIWGSMAGIPSHLCALPEGGGGYILRKCVHCSLVVCSWPNTITCYCTGLHILQSFMVMERGTHTHRCPHRHRAPHK